MDGRMHGRTDARTDGRTDNVKTVYPLQTKFAGGIISRQHFHVKKKCVLFIFCWMCRCVDRSAVSWRLYMENFPLILLTKLTGCRTYIHVSLCKTCGLQSGAIFGPQGHDLNKLGRCYKQNIKAVDRMVLDKIFYAFPIYRTPNE